MQKARLMAGDPMLIPSPDRKSSERILIVDDDMDFAESIQDMLEMRGYECATAHSVADFPGAAAHFAPQVCLIDNRLGTESGIALLESIAVNYPDIIPIMMTGFADTDAAIEALRHHAYDYLRKPIEAEDLFASLSRAFEKQKLIRQRKNSELALLTSEEKFSKAFASNPVPIAIVSLKDQKLLDVNDAFETFSGYCRAEANGSSMRDLGLWTEPNDEESLMQGLRAFGSVRDYELFLRTRAGNVRDCVASAEAVTIRHEPCTIVAIEDQTYEREAQQALGKSEHRFRSLYDTMPAMFLTIDANGNIKSVNSYGARMLGHEITAIVGSSIYDYVLADSKDQQTAFISRCFADPQTTQVCEVGFEQKESESVWLRETGQVTPCADGGSELLVVCEDITVTRKLSEKLSFQASHDELTGLVNRREFEHRLRRVLQTAKERNSEHTLCYLDLDRFKVINDTCGHVAGDELLRQVCYLLKQCVRKRDTLARLGGDEFAILMEDCDIERTCRVSSQIHDALKRFRFSWDDKAFSVGVSIGMVAVDPSFGDVKEVLSAADAACYEAKNKGTNRQHIYSADDADLVRRHDEMQWVTKINDALDDGRFELFQQSMQPLQSDNAPKRIEILLRLRGKDGTLVEPADFLPAAEHYDLAPKIDQWVIENTFDWIRENRADLNNVGLFCINISGRSLGDEQFLAFVESLFARGGVPAAMICFEITETAAIKHLVNATRFISAFKLRGCSFALDDFGAGLSSFAYLKNLHVDIIKIDGQFITGMEDDPVKLAIVKSINEIGKVMGKATVAEFVQSAQELQLAKELGIDYAQGFFIAQPVPLATD